MVLHSRDSVCVCVCVHVRLYAGVLWLDAYTHRVSFGATTGIY